MLNSDDDIFHLFIGINIYSIKEILKIAGLIKMNIDKILDDKSKW